MIIFRYLAREVMLTMLAVSTVLLIIFMSARFVKYLAEAAAGDMSGDILFAIMLYRMPAFLELILPLGFFVGILLAYGRLYAESEMVVLFACGTSKRRLLTNCMVPAFFVMMLVAVFSWYLTPLGLGKFYEIWDDPKNFGGIGILLPRRFQTVSEDNLIAYTEEVDKEEGQMVNVFLATEDKRGAEGKAVIIVADNGAVLNPAQDGSRYIELRSGYRYEGNPGELDFKVTRFETFGQLIKESKEELIINRARARSTSELMSSTQVEDIAALQWRFSIPITVPIVALIALAMSETNPRQGRFVKLLPAVLVYIAYLVLLIAARNGVEEEVIPPSIGLWWIHLLFLIMGIVLYYWDEISLAHNARRNARLRAG